MGSSDEGRGAKEDIARVVQVASIYAGPGVKSKVDFKFKK